MVGMEIGAHVSQLRMEGPLLAAAADRAGWDAAVPGTDWHVRELVTHIGGVHRWAADIVRTGASESETEAGNAVGTGPGDDELLDWFAAGHAALVETLACAPDDLECATFLPAPSPLAFWARRQAHETAVHRADAEAAAGQVTVFPVASAQDGIAEMLHGFAARKSNAIERDATLSLLAGDGPPWRVMLGGERIVAAESDEPAEVTISGTSSDLYRWLWNRPAAVIVTGDETVAALWRTIRVRWS